LFPSKEEAKQKALVLKTSGLITDFFIRAINEISRTAAGDCEPGTTIYFLHVSSNKQKIYAENEVQKLKKYGYNAFTILQDVDGVSWFRVYTGEFDSEDKARKLGSELKEKGLSSYFKPISIDKIIKPSGIDALTFLQQSASLRQHEKSIPPGPAEPELIKHARQDQKISEEVIEKDKLPLVISDITFSAKKGEKELVLLHVNRYFSPSVFFNLEEEKPTIVIDVDPPASVKNVPSKTPVKGKWIKQIETQSNSNSKTLRIIVYLHASENYKVSQSFYRSEKIFAIKVTAKEKARKK